jgi:hypothetical protein
MMTPDQFPQIMHSLQELLLEQYELDCQDFQPFLESEETTSIIQAWTSNPNLSNLDFKGITYDGSGGFFALWLVYDDSILEQPVVFLGSDGERYVVAENLADFLWSLAYGIPLNDPTKKDMSRFYREDSAFMEFACKYALAEKRSIAEIVAGAITETKSFREFIESVTR